MITKKPGQSGTTIVTFLLPAAIWADTIHLVGDFNNWDCRATPLKLDDTAWRVSLELENGKSYHYRYLLNDSEWTNDWNADAIVASQDGNDNSVVITPGAGTTPVPPPTFLHVLSAVNLWKGAVQPGANC